jgi:hypothetical protein
MGIKNPTQLVSTTEAFTLATGIVVEIVGIVVYLNDQLISLTSKIFL